MNTGGERDGAHITRLDDFEVRRRHLVDMSDEELASRFWGLAERVVEPLVNLARTHTSPSIERSVLLRMGFSSLEAKAVVDKCVERGLLGKGAGHVVWMLAHARGMSVREAGVALCEGKMWDDVADLFGQAR